MVLPRILSLQLILTLTFVSLDSNVHTCLLWSYLPTITLVIVLAIVIVIAILSNSNKNSNSSSSSSSNNNNNNNNNVVNFEDLWESCSYEVRSKLVNIYLTDEISKQGGKPHDKPVEIIVNFRSTAGSLFFIKHKRDLESSESSSNSVADNNFETFKRRISLNPSACRAG